MPIRWSFQPSHHRWLVLASWFIAIALGLAGGTNLTSHLSTSLTVPGSQSEKADVILVSHFGENSEGNFTILYTFGNASDSQIVKYKNEIEVAASVIPTAVVTQQKALGGVLLASVATSFPLNKAAPYTQKLRDALSVQLPGALVSGPPAIDYDVSPILARDLRRGELVAIFLGIVLLILLLGFSFVVLIPFVFAIATISVAIGFIFLLAQKFLMVLYIPNIVELIGLGLAIDYSLLIVHRFRRELLNDASLSVDEAIRRTMKSAGRTVFFSGITVSITLATLLLVPVPFIRSLGAAGILVPLISMVNAFTLLPVLLYFLGRKGVTAFRFHGLLSQRNVLNGFWARSAHFSTRKPLVTFLASGATLLVLATSVIWLQVTPSSLTAIPSHLESAQVLTVATEKIGSGVITPHVLVIDLGKPGLASTPEINAARLKLARQLLTNPEAYIVASDITPTFVDASGRYMRIYIVGRHILGSDEASQFVTQLREKYIPQAQFPKGTQIFLGGAPAQGVDLLKTLSRSIPCIIGIAIILIYLLLLKAFRSILLPLKALLLDLFSISVAIASVVAVFRFGFGQSILHTYRLDQIEAWSLIFMFVILFGLSMDYELFMVSRIREAHESGLDNRDSVIAGMAHTGGVVSAAALIMVTAVSGLVVGHFAGLQQLGIGLSVGVLVDATIVRGLLLPSSMVLLDKWNWWIPQSFSKFIKK
jgi:RND superfamily putative drug exporter